MSRSIAVRMMQMAIRKMARLEDFIETLSVEARKHPEDEFYIKTGFLELSYMVEELESTIITEGKSFFPDEDEEDYYEEDED